MNLAVLIISIALLVLSAIGCICCAHNIFLKTNTLQIGKQVLFLCGYLAIMIVTIPIIINELYLHQDGYLTLWGASDVLMFYGSVLSFIGTVSLGGLAIWQNFKLKEMSDNKDQYFLKIENEKLRIQYLPQFLIQSSDADACVDRRYILSEHLQQTHIALKKQQSFIFDMNTEQIGWVSNELFPVIEKDKVNLLSAIINCGNNTAHQVKLSIILNGQEYMCEKTVSVRKDDEIYFYFGVKRELTLPDNTILKIRFFDSFQNVYEQKFSIRENDGVIWYISFSDVQLIKKNSCMEIEKI